jgi:alcohol dehydrogenase class IV
MYGLPHGHAVAVCLPEIWHHMLSADECIDKRGRGYVQSVFKEIANSMDCSGPEEAIGLFREMIDSMDLANPISTGDYPTEIELLARSVNPIRLKNNPISLDTDTITSLYATILL